MAARYGEPVNPDDVEPSAGAPDDTEHEEVERHASWAELFFDLVAVAGVASLAHVLAVELGWASLGLYAVLFLAVWLAWTTFMLYGNVAGSRTHVLRLLIGMFGLGVMAASVPGVTHTLLDGGHETRAVTAFTIAYVVTRVYGAQSWRRGEVLLDFPVAQHTVGVLPWVISLWTHPPVTVALWALGVAVDLWLVLVVSGNDMLERYENRVSAVVDREERAQRRVPRGGPAGGRRREADAVRQAFQVVPVMTDPAHLAERLGLFVIIVLGEGVVQVVDAASEAVPETGLFLAGLASFVLLAGMFGLSVQYGFAGVPHLRADAVPARARARAALRGHRGDRDGLGGARVGRRARQRAARHRAALAALRCRGRVLPDRPGRRHRGQWAGRMPCAPCGSPPASSFRCSSGCVGAALPATVLTGLIALVVVGQVLVEARVERPTDD